jgi:hypothetical protein
MAKLLDTQYRLPRLFECGNDWNEYFAEQEKALDEIPVEKLYSYPVADGRALYYIVSMSPLVLQHIPFLDAYQLPMAHIRGLRREDVEQHIQFEKNIREVFSEKRKENE